MDHFRNDSGRSHYLFLQNVNFEIKDIHLQMYIVLLWKFQLLNDSSMNPLIT